MIKLLKYFLLLMCATLSVEESIAKKINNMEDFKTEFGDKYIIGENSLSLQKVINFPGENSNSLKAKVKNYINNRPERLVDNYAAESNILIDENTIFSAERSIIFETGTFFCASVNYKLKIDIKESKIRVTISIYGINIPNSHNVPLSKYYPFCKETNKPFRNTSKKMYHQFFDYANNIFNDISRKLLIEDDDW